MKHPYIPIATLSLLIISPFATASQTIARFDVQYGAYTASTPVNPNDFNNHVEIIVKFKPDRTYPLVQQTDDGYFKVNQEGLYSITCSLVLQNDTTGRPFDGKGGYLASYLRVNDKNINHVNTNAFQGSTTPAGFSYLGSPVSADLYLTKDDHFSCIFFGYGTGNFADQHKLYFDTDSSFMQVRPLFPYDDPRQEL